MSFCGFSFFQFLKKHCKQTIKTVFLPISLYFIHSIHKDLVWLPTATFIMLSTLFQRFFFSSKKQKAVSAVLKIDFQLNSNCQWYKTITTTAAAVEFRSSSYILFYFTSCWHDSLLAKVRTKILISKLEN